jgi:hypothetical protein
MRNKISNVIWLLFGLLLAATLWAHHSISAEFDTSKTFTVTGTLTKIEWVNPHAYVYLDAKDDKGVVRNYSFETGPPGNLRRAGVLRTMFNVGETVTVDAFAAKDGSQHLGLVKAYHFADGRTIIIGRDPGEVERANK